MKSDLNRRRLAVDFLGDTTAPLGESATGGETSRSSRIGRNTAINIGGASVPLLLAVATVPPYLHLIGEARYGVLAVVWVVLGYFGVFDLGLSRATANQIARMRDDTPARRERVFWTALSVNGAAGVIGGVILFFVGRALLEHVISVSPALRAEAVDSLPWLAVAVPLTTVTLVLAGTLEGRERFLTVNALTIAGLAMFQLGPLAYAYWVGPQLPGLVMAATLALSASTLLSFVVTAATLPARRPQVDRGQLGTLVRYGGWVTLTGLVGPLLTVVDRVVIGSVLNAAAVARYAIPFALVSRTQVLSSGLARTIFPRFSMLDTGDAAHVSRESLRALVAVMTSVTVIGAVALDPFLRLWVGASIAASSAPVGEILLIGIFLNSLAAVPFAFLQARGRPDLPAKFHVLELAPYIGGLVLGLHLAGIKGAAWAWSGRVAADAVLLFWAARKYSGETPPAPWRALARGSALAVAACIASLTIFHLSPFRLVVGGPLVVVALVTAWREAPARVRLEIRLRLSPRASRP